MKLIVPKKDAISIINWTNSRRDSTHSRTEVTEVKGGNKETRNGIFESLMDSNIFIIRQSVRFFFSN